MPRPKKNDGTGAPVRSDGRKATLTYLREDTIDLIKKTAIDRKTTAFLIIEQAVHGWLIAEGLMIDEEGAASGPEPSVTPTEQKLDSVTNKARAAGRRRVSAGA